jgi:hypothetical protein
MCPQRPAHVPFRVGGTGTVAPQKNGRPVLCPPAISGPAGMAEMPVLSDHWSTAPLSGRGGDHVELRVVGDHFAREVVEKPAPARELLPHVLDEQPVSTLSCRARGRFAIVGDRGRVREP